MQYKLSISKIVDYVVPLALRKPVLLAFAKSFLSPIQTLFNTFLIYRLYSVQEKNKNSQVILLRAALWQYVGQNGGFRPSEANNNTPVPNDIFVEDYEHLINLPVTTLMRERLIESDMLVVGLTSEKVTASLATIEETIPPFDFQVKIRSIYIKDGTLKTVRSVVDAYRNIGRNYIIQIID